MQIIERRIRNGKGARNEKGIKNDKGYEIDLEP